MFKKRFLATAPLAAVVGLIGLSVATPAQADVWDNVAQCESGGNWSTKTGNGYSGGLQFTQSTWSANGGTGSAHNASKAEQKRVAQNVLKSQGPGAWPHCGKVAGLSQSNGKVSSSSTSQKLSFVQSQKSNRSYTVTLKKQYINDSRQKTVIPQVARSLVRLPDPKRIDPDALPVPTPVHAPKTGVRYVVKTGDTLAKIADAHKTVGGWQKLASNNGLVDPDVIYVGQILYLP